DSLSALGGGEGPLPNPPPLAGEGRVGAGGAEGWGEVEDSRALANKPTSPSRRFATGPFLSPLKGGEGSRQRLASAWVTAPAPKRARCRARSAGTPLRDWCGR